MSELHSLYGYALRRNGTCLSNEVDCGPTWTPYHACCPHGTICPLQSSTSICCQSQSDCSALLQGHPHCGNSSANLYFADNYFCCADGAWGFELDNGFVGCVNNVSELAPGTKQLAIVSEGSTALPTPTSTISSTAIPTPTTSSQSFSSSSSTGTSTTILPTNNSTATSPSSSVNAGAIAGGVVGGVAAVSWLALIWFLIRRRNKRKQSQDSGMSDVNDVNGMNNMNHTSAELRRETQYGGEFGSLKRVKFSELPGDIPY